MKKREEKKITLFDFVKPTREERKDGGANVTVAGFIEERRRVYREEIVKWSKEVGITPAALARAIDELTRERKIRKKIDDEGKMYYEWVTL